MPLKSVCSVCKKVLGYKEGGEGVSHGLCPKCHRLLEIEDILSEDIESKAVELFGETKVLEEAKFVLRDGTLIGCVDYVHYDICNIDEVAEYILLTLDPKNAMTLAEARAKHPTAGNTLDILDMEIDGAMIDACPDAFLAITGAGRIVPDSAGFYFNFSKLPSLMQCRVIARALREKASVGVEVTGLPNYVYLSFHEKLAGEAILKRLEDRGLKDQADLRGTTGHVPNLTSGKVLEQRAVKEFGITENPLWAGYLLKDGRFLDFSYGGEAGQRVRDHREVEGLFSDQELDFVRPKTGGRTLLMWEFMARTGAIRMKPEGCAAEGPQIFPTRPQARSLNDYALVCEGTILFEAWRKSNPRSKVSGFFTAGSAEDILRVAKRLEEHPERFDLERPAFLIGKSDWGLKGMCMTTVAHLHSHEYSIDATGNGETAVDFLHSHPIVGFVVQEVLHHTHELINAEACVTKKNLLGGSSKDQLIHAVKKEFQVTSPDTIDAAFDEALIFEDGTVASPEGYLKNLEDTTIPLPVLLSDGAMWVGFLEEVTQGILEDHGITFEKALEVFSKLSTVPVHEIPLEAIGLPILEKVLGPSGFDIDLDVTNWYLFKTQAGVLRDNNTDLTPLIGGGKKWTVEEFAKYGRKHRKAFTFEFSTMPTMEQVAAAYDIAKYWWDEGTRNVSSTGAYGAPLVISVWHPDRLAAMKKDIPTGLRKVSKDLIIVVFLPEKLVQFCGKGKNLSREDAVDRIYNEVFMAHHKGHSTLHGLPHLGGLPKVGEGDSEVELAVKLHGLTHLGALDGLILAEVTHQGHFFKTGVPVTFRYARNTEKAPYFGPRFQQDVEPAGRYVIVAEVTDMPSPWEFGEARFENPLVLKFSDTGMYDDTSWKARLSKHFGATGKALTKKLIAAGYDGVVTVASVGGFTREIVCLKPEQCSPTHLGAIDIPHFGDANFADVWLEAAKGSFEEAYHPDNADWILPDGHLLKSHGHSMVCWSLQDALIQNAIDEELKEWYGFYDILDQLRKDFPDLTDDQIGETWIREMADDQNANDWCEERFIDVTGAVRHASVAWEQAKPAFELHEIPTTEQAKKIAEIIEIRRPRFLGEAEFYYGGRLIQMEFPKRASAAGVIAKLKREVPEEDWDGLGALEPPIAQGILELVDGLIEKREEPKREALRRAAGDLKRRIEKLAADAGVEIKYAEGGIEDAEGEIGLKSMIELPEKVNVVKLRPPTAEERAAWEREKAEYAKKLEYHMENPFLLPHGVWTFKDRDAFNATTELLEQTMQDKFLDWLNALGHYPGSIQIDLYMWNKHEIMARLESGGEEEIPLDETRWKLTLSSEFMTSKSSSHIEPWRSEEMENVGAEEINWVMKKFERPLDSLHPEEPWPVGMIENFNTAWDAFAGEMNDAAIWAGGKEYARPGMIDVFEWYRVSGSAWNLAALYVPVYGVTAWFAAELNPPPTSRVKLPDFKDAKDLIIVQNQDYFEIGDIALETALTGAMYISQDFPLFIAPHLWKIDGPGLFDIKDAFKSPISVASKDIVRVAFEIGHLTSGLTSGLGIGMQEAFRFPIACESAACVWSELIEKQSTGKDKWTREDARKAGLVENLRKEYANPTGQELSDEDFFGEIATWIAQRGKCDAFDISNFIVDRRRIKDLSGIYSFREDEMPNTLEFKATAYARGMGHPEDGEEELEGLGALPTASDIVTSIVAHLQAVESGRLEGAPPESADAAAEGLLRGIREFVLRLQASCTCENGFEWCCPEGRRVLPTQPLTKRDEEEIAGIRAQLRRLGGYAEEGVAVRPLFVKGQEEVLLEMKDRAGQFSFRGEPAKIRRQLGLMSAPPEAGRVWHEGQIRSFWYVLASNDRFILDDAGWRWSVMAPPEFFGCTFISKLKKYTGWVSVNYEWGISSSKFTHASPDQLIHINTGLGAKHNVFIPFPILDFQKDISKEDQRALMRCVALEANSIVPDGLFEESKVIAHLKYGSEKVSGKEAESVSKALDNLSGACRAVTVDELPSKRKRTVTLGSIHGFPGCCGVNNG